MVPIGDRFTMSPFTAVLAVERFFKPDTVIPCQYVSFPPRSLRRGSDRVDGLDRHGERSGLPPLLAFLYELSDSLLRARQG